MNDEVAPPFTIYILPGPPGPGGGTFRGEVRSMKFTELQVPDHLKIGLEPGAKIYNAGKLKVIVGRHPIDGRWHLSISHPKRYPTWDEIKAARYQLIPNNVTMAMLLPPKEQYINIHNNCFHLWEIREEIE